MLEAAPPPMHALLSHGENPDRIGKPVRPRGGGGGKDLIREGGKDRRQPVKPTQLLSFPLQDGHCHSSASLLGKEDKKEDTEGCSQTERGHRDHSASAAPSHFAKSRGGSELACVHCLATPGSLSGHTGGRGAGCAETQEGNLPPSLTSSPPAPSAGATASHASPWGLLPQSSTD